MDGPPRPLLNMLGVEIPPEQVFPQVPVGLHPQIALADGEEDRRLQDGVGGEVVQLHLVVVAERADESPDGYADPPLVQPRQADNVAVLMVVKCEI